MCNVVPTWHFNTAFRVQWAIYVISPVSYNALSYVQGVILCFVTEVIPSGLPFTSHERLKL